MESWRKQNAVAVARAAFGIVAAVALTAGFTWAVASELQRGFAPVYEAQQNARMQTPRNAAAAAPVRAPATRCAEADKVANPAQGTACL